MVNSLPLELVDHIIHSISAGGHDMRIESRLQRQNQLYQLSLVNRDWHYSASTSLWRSLTMRHDRMIERTLSQAVASSSHQYYSLVRELIFTRDTDPRLATELIIRCPNLRRLHFNWHIGTAEAKHLKKTMVHSLSQLQHLCLNGCYFMCNPFDLISSIATRASATLETIAFEASEINFRFTPNNQPLAVASCVMERLHTIKITDNTGFTDSSLISLFAIPQMLPRLQCLDLSGSRSLTDWSLPMVLRNFPNLKRIRLANTLVSANTIQTIADTCAATLEELIIGTREQPFKSSLSDFHWYSFMRIPCQTIQHLAEKCSRLRTLHLNGCDELTDEAVAEMILSLPKLQELDIGRSAITMHLFGDLASAPFASDKLSQSRQNDKLLQRLCQLRYLGVSGCQNLHLAVSQGKRTQLGPFERLLLTDFTRLERLDCSQLPGIQTRLLYRYRATEPLPESIKYLSNQYAGLYEMTACVLDTAALREFRDVASQLLTQASPVAIDGFERFKLC